MSAYPEYRKDQMRRLSPAVNVHYDKGTTFRIMVDDRCYGNVTDEDDAWRIAKQQAKQHPFAFVDLICPEA